MKKSFIFILLMFMLSSVQADDEQAVVEACLGLAESYLYWITEFDKTYDELYLSFMLDPERQDPLLMMEQNDRCEQLLPDVFNRLKRIK